MLFFGIIAETKNNIIFVSPLLFSEETLQEKKLQNPFISNDNFKHSSVKTLIFSCLSDHINYGSIWKMRVWSFPCQKTTKEKCKHIFISTDFELTQKLSQDVRCCVHNCSLVLACMYVCLFVFFCSLFQLQCTLEIKFVVTGIVQ